MPKTPSTLASKGLVGLVALQAVAIGYLGMQLQNVGQEVSKTAEAIAALELPAAPVGEPVLSVADLKKMIRTENTTLVRATLTADKVNRKGRTPSPVYAEAPKPTPSVDPQKIGALNADIDQILTRMSASDLASSRDVNALLGSIAKLPPEERTRALGKFNRALNSGLVAAAL